MQSTAQEDELNRLKTLLLRPEKAELAQIQSDIDGLSQRVGTRDRLETATAEILVEAFKRAETTQHRELANAVAPVIVGTIHTEIKNSKDLLIEALYPITGRIVAASISKLFSDFTRSINTRIENLTSARSIGWRVKSILTGRPVSEIALSDSIRPTVRKLMVVERGSGILNGYWDIDPESAQKPELVSGMIAAITDFSANAFGDSSGQLKALDLGSARIFLNASASTIVAAEISGPLSIEDEAELDRRLSSIAIDQEEERDVTESALANHARELFTSDDATSDKKSSNRPLIIIGIILAIGLCWYGYTRITNWLLERNVIQALDTLKTARPYLRSFPVTLDFDHGTSQLTVSGLVSKNSDIVSIKDSLAPAAGGYKQRYTLSAVANEPGTTSRLNALETLLQKQVAALKTTEISELNKLTVQLKNSIDTKTRILQEQQALLAKNIAILNKDTEGLKLTANNLKSRDSQQDRHVETLQKDVNAKLGKVQNTLAATTSNLRKSIAEKTTSATKSQKALALQLQKQIANMSKDIANFAQLKNNLDLLASTIEKNQSKLNSEISKLNQGLEKSERLLKSTAAVQTSKIKKNTSAAKQLSARFERPNFRLRQTLSRFAIFFTSDLNIFNPDAVTTTLAQIAELQKRSGLPLRIIGHSDTTGTASINKAISTTRANLIVKKLVALGVSRSKLKTAGRSDRQIIAEPISGGAPANRRVVIEIQYENERSKQ